MRSASVPTLSGACVVCRCRLRVLKTGAVRNQCFASHLLVGEPRPEGDAARAGVDAGRELYEGACAVGSEGSMWRGRAGRSAHRTAVCMRKGFDAGRESCAQGTVLCAQEGRRGKVSACGGLCTF